MTTRRATLSSVAQAAGVSRQTVSNVLKRPDRVQPETAARVRAAIEAHNVPSVAARQLRTQAGRAASATGSPRRATASAVRSSTASCTPSPSTRSSRATACPSSPPATTPPRRSPTPTPAHDRPRRVRPVRHRPRATRAPGGSPTRASLRDVRPPLGGRGHPARLGRRRRRGRHPRSDRAPPGRRPRAHRLPRLARRLRGRRRPPPRVAGSSGDHAGPEVECVDDVPAARATFAAVLPDVTAVVCASDTLALGAHGAALRAGAPLDVVGFDDTPVAAALGLSSVAQPLPEAAAAVVRILHDQIDGRSQSPSRCCSPRAWSSAAAADPAPADPEGEITMKRTRALLAAGATSVLLLTACGGSGFDDQGSGGGQQSSGPRKLQVLIGSSGQAETNAVTQAADAWGEERRGLRHRHGRLRPQPAARPGLRVLEPAGRLLRRLGHGRVLRLQRVRCWPTATS